MLPSIPSRMFVLMALVLCCGCASNNEGKIEGTKWNSLASTVNGRAIPAGAIHFEFGREGSLIYRAGNSTVSGRYSLGSGENITLHLNQELGGKKTHVQKMSVEGDLMTMREADGTQITFAKLK